MSDVATTLDQRQEVYGDYKKGITLECHIMELLNQHHKDAHGIVMLELEAAMFRKVVMKLARLAVTPSHVDSWHDVAGYAMLNERMLKEGGAIAEG